MTSMSEKYPSLKRFEGVDDDDVVEVRYMKTPCDSVATTALGQKRLTFLSLTTAVKSDSSKQSKPDQTSSH